MTSSGIKTLDLSLNTTSNPRAAPTRLAPFQNDTGSNSNTTANANNSKPDAMEPKRFYEPIRSTEDAEKIASFLMLGPPVQDTSANLQQCRRHRDEGHSGSAPGSLPRVIMRCFDRLESLRRSRRPRQSRVRLPLWQDQRSFSALEPSAGPSTSATLWVDPGAHSHRATSST